MNAFENTEARPSHASSRWPEPLTPAEWDRRYPGILDAVGIMAAASNVIMQLAKSGVGYGVVESPVEGGQIFRHPVKRTRTTLTYLAVAMLGTREEKLAYRKAITRVHAQVRSTAKSPVQYSALDPKLQLWVAACLYWGFADNLTKFRGPMDPAAAEALYKELAPLGTTLQVGQDMWPATLDDFEDYWEQELKQIRIDDTVRAYLTDIADLKFFHPAVSFSLGWFSRFLTTGFLPAPVREQMQFSWGPRRQRAFDLSIGLVGAVNRLLPRFVRQTPFNIVMADFRHRLRKGAPLN